MLCGGIVDSLLSLRGAVLDKQDELWGSGFFTMFVVAVQIHIFRRYLQYVEPLMVGVNSI